jgi:hypothetical protein
MKFVDTSISMTEQEYEVWNKKFYYISRKRVLLFFDGWMVREHIGPSRRSDIIDRRYLFKTKAKAEEFVMLKKLEQ